MRIPMTAFADLDWGMRTESIPRLLIHIVEGRHAMRL